MALERNLEVYMEFLSSLVAIIFIAIAVGVALTFGFAMLLWVMFIMVLISLSAILRDVWRRWRFLRHAEPKSSHSPKVIEGEYKDISK